MKRLKTPLVAAGGALVAYLFDPVSGRRRRAQLRGRVPAFFRRRENALNDPTLARTVETADEPVPMHQ